MVSSSQSFDRHGLQKPDISPYLLGLFGALILLAPAIVNGTPFLYTDSITYFKRADFLLGWLLEVQQNSKAGNAFGADLVQSRNFVESAMSDAGRTIVLGGRSPFYAALITLGLVFDSVWSAPAIQAFVVATMAALVAKRLTGAVDLVVYLGGLTALAWLTPLGLFVGMLMPDIWAGILIAAMAVLAVLWPQLAPVDVLLLLAVIFSSVLFHDSHKILAFALLAAWAAARVVPRWRPALGGAKPMVGAALCIAGGLVAAALVERAVELTTGDRMVRLPFLTAQLTEDEQGVATLQEMCQRRDFAVCVYLDRLPTPWTRFLFESDPASGVFWVAPDAVKRRISDEDMAVMLDASLSHPLATLRMLTLDGLQQVVRFSPANVPKPLPPEGLPAVADRLEEGRLIAQREWLRLLSVSTALLTVAGACLLAAAASSAKLRLRHPLGPTFQALAALVLCGVVLNGLLCGALASPYDRFQARVIWLVPAVAVLWFTLFAGERRARRSQSRFAGRSGG